MKLKTSHCVTAQRRQGFVLIAVLVVITGVGDNQSFAWFIAKYLQAAGARIVLASHPRMVGIVENILERDADAESRVLPYGAGSLKVERVVACDVRFDSIDDTYSDESPWFMSDEPNAFEQLAENDQREALIEAIAELPEREQQVIQLYYVEELNLEEIGQVLGVGAARICQIKASAHARLKKGLARRLG